MANRVSRFLVVGVSLVFAACGGDNLTLPSEGEPAAIAVDAGWNGITGRVGTELAPLNVTVTDTKNRPVAGATVEFEVTAGAGLVNPASAVTGNDGRATTHLTLGSVVGPVSGVARVPVPAGTVPVQTTFNATAVSADANGMALVSGDNQSGLVGTALALPLVVKVTDGFNNPIAGVPIQWAVGAGEGGSVSEASTNTDPQGLASVTRTLGSSAGNQTTVATGPVGLAGSPVTFNHVANAGNVSSVVKISGDGQSVAAGSTITVVVEVRDASNNPIANQPVNWLVGEGAGTVTPPTSNTNAQGQASAQWTLGLAPATNTLNVVAGGATATFTATGTGTGAASVLAITAQPPASVELGAVLTPATVVQIRDNAGHALPLPGVDVTVSLESAGSARLDGDRTVTTDANGAATFSDLRINGATGARRLIFAAADLTGARSNRIEVTKASTTTTITDDPAQTIPGQAVTVNFTVTSSAGTPTGNVEVSGGGGPSCTGTLAGGSGSCTLQPTSQDDFTITANYKGDGLFAVSSDDEPHDVVPAPPPPNQAPDAVDDNYQAVVNTTLVIPDGTQPGLLANDTDPDTDDDHFTEKVTDPTNGTVTVGSLGSFTYTPNPDFVGTDSFTYRNTDRPPGQGGLSDVATVTITVQ